MQANHTSPKTSYRSTTPPLDSSSEDLDFCLDYDLDDLEKIDHPRKPHFLDYDYVPPPGYDEPNSNSSIATATDVLLCTKNDIAKKSPSGEHIKMDKKYELDGEISDSVLAAANKQNNQKLFTSSVEETSMASSSNDSAVTIVNQMEYVHTGTKKKKQIYAEEIARVAPLYCREREREHRSLDRNFERLGENINLKYERKFSLDRDGPPNFATPRFLDRDVSPIYHRGTWPSDKPHDIQAELSKLGPKVECVYSLLSMLGSNNSIEMSIKFLDLSKSPETCIALRRSGCIPLLVQMMHSDSDEMARKRAGQALHNVVHCHPDDKVGRREAKVLRLIEQIIEYNEFLKNLLKIGESVCDDMERHPSQAIYSLMKISFDEEHRHAMCQLGALPAIANLVYLDHTVHGSKSAETRCITLRRYSGMALTNLTFGDGNNKALLCSNKNFMKSLVNQLDGSPEELIQVTACVLRNLSWRADNNIKLILTEIGTVTALTKAAMKNRNENTLKSILSALWNLTAHCSMNKAELCNVEGALAFLADMLVFEAPGKNLSIIENAGGILRNVSSHIAVREDYRKILRQRNCLGILLQQLKSESLTVVSNACGTLWNLSARCAEDQKFLCDNGAVPMLRSLVHSKHKMISNGSNAALKNLLNFKPPTGLNTNALDPIAKSMNLKELPSLNMRKQRALEEDLDQNLSETCENIDVVTPPKEEQNVQDFCTMDQNFHHKSNVYLPKNTPIVKSNSKDSVTSLKSTNSTDTTSDESKEEPTPTTSKCFPQKVQTTEAATFLKYNDESSECDQLTDFSVKYNREQKNDPSPKEGTNTFTVYQETDLDQITDYSLRYAEKHSELEEKHNNASRPYGNEMILTLEDTVKCYETEGTPYAISNAASMSDLRNHKSDNEKLNDKLKVKKSNIDEISENFNVSGINTPEKPVNYCEEGTPGYFSRRDSISSIDETVSSKTDKIKIIQKNDCASGMVVEDIPEIDEMDINGSGVIMATTPGGSSTSKVVTFEPETPLMFSRHSSIESLSSVEPDCVDDQSSVVSEFSRLASGIISPSELPDSPTQSMPQTPRTGGGTNHIPRSQPAAIQSNAPPPLRSVFEDNINTFGVENTPAQFSCATSLSNLSLDDEPKISADNLTKDMRLIPHPSEELDEEPLNNQGVLENGLKVEDVDDIKENLDSDGEESTNDDILLATCINIGMNRGARHKQNEEVNSNMSLNTNDDIIKYCTEGTPAILSKSASNTNLSMLSLETNKEEPAMSDDSSNSSDIGNDRLLEECIRDGMKKSSSKEFNEPKGGSMVYKENPIAMMRSGGSLLTPYLLNKDETNKFNVEDSPCNFSAMSALSNLTIESDIGGTTAQAQRPLIKNSQRKERHDMMSRNFNQPSADDSLSSLSVDSEEDNNLLSQAIEAGFQSKPKYGSARSQVLNQASSSRTIMVGRYEPQNNNDPNESLSSIDSYESNENQNNSLLEQAIRSGMNREPKPAENKTLPSAAASITKKSFLPMFKNLTLLERDKQKDRDKKDEQLLLECINTGMTKSLRSEQSSKPPKIVQQQQIALPPPPSQSVIQSQVATQPPLTAQHLFSLNHQRITQNSDFIPNSKNGQATSVVVSEMKSAPSTTTDVGKDLVDGTNGSKEDHIQHNTISRMQNGSSIAFDVSTNQSINQFLNSSENLLETSNEYPALRISHLEFTEENSLNNSMDMDLSNEFLIDAADPSSNSQKIDKHKDPDLMLKSVERLTHELVSTAEYLRTNGSNNDDSNTNNTWNEDTCPHDVSFPSISVTIPMVESFDDTTFSDVMASKSWILEEATPTNEFKNFVPPAEPILIEDDFTRDSSLDTTLTYEIPNGEVDNQFDSLEPDSGTITAQYYDKPPNSNGINFEVGGEVKHAAFVQSTLLPFGMTTSIIAREAHKVVDHLRNFSNQMTDSVTSLDLEQIRPPSAMDNLSMSGYFEIPHSPQLSRNRKKSLPAGLVARRALGHIQTNGGSLESVNSSCNLDNIKPPSLMDELLDSMISVASITSEIADSQYDATSLYDTAMSDVDDTLTLQSALDMPSDATPIQSDFSSAESTPRKSSKNSKRSLTPKQKRQLAKDRYRTYTIAADMVLKEKLEEIKMEQKTDDTDDTEVEEEVIKVEIDETRQRMTPRQKRLENRARFETQVLDIGMLGSSSSLEQCNGSAETVYSIKNHERYRSPTINTNLVNNFNNLINDDDEDASIRAMTERFTYIHGSVNITSTTTTPTETKTITEVINFDTSSNGYRPTTNGHLETFTSEAESSLDNDYTSDTSEEFRTFTKPMTRIVKPDEKSRELPQLIQPPEVKAIRGGKKAAYVSPYRRTVINNNSKNTSPKHNSSSNINGRTNLATKINGDTKKTMKTPASANLIPKNQTVVSKTHVVINKTNLSNKINGLRKNTAAQKPITSHTINVTKTTKTTIASPPPPERQGTFTKDEPTNIDVPVVSSMPSSPSKFSKLPTRATSVSQNSSRVTTPKSPAKTFMSKLKIPIQKSASMDADKIAAAQRKPLPKVTSPPPSTIDTQKRRSLGVFKSPSVPSVPMRSNSNTSMKNINNITVNKRNLPITSPPSRSNSTVTKGNITSKIAGLWKKSEEPKIKNQKNTTTIKAPEPPPTSKLIRSSTFDSTPETNLPVNKNNNKPTAGAATGPATSRLSQIASKYRSTTSSQPKPQKSPSGSNIKNLTNGFGGTESTLPSKRVSRIGTFINNGVDE